MAPRMAMAAGSSSLLCSVSETSVLLLLLGLLQVLLADTSLELLLLLLAEARQQRQLLPVGNACQCCCICVSRASYECELMISLCCERPGEAPESSGYLSFQHWAVAEYYFVGREAAEDAAISYVIMAKCSRCHLQDNLHI